MRYASNDPSSGQGRVSTGSAERDKLGNRRLGQCFGMTPEEVRLDVAEADESSLVCQSHWARVRSRGERLVQAPRKES